METDRLILKNIEKSMDQDFFLLHSDPEVVRYVREPDKDIFETKKTINSLIKYQEKYPKLGLWSAYLKSNNEFIGWVLLIHVDMKSTNPIEVSYRIHKKFRGKGYAAEMVERVISYGKSLGIEKLCAITSEENFASHRVFEKVGLKYQGMRTYYGTEVRFYE